MDAYGKVGLYYDEKEEKWYLPIGEAPSTHIVKQSHVRLKKIVANEQMCLLTAKYLGIEIPESFIVTTGGDDETVLFATKRYDRKFIKENNILNRFMNWRIKLWLSFRKKCENMLHWWALLTAESQSVINVPGGEAVPARVT